MSGEHLDPVVLVGLRAALQAGVAPVTALAQVPGTSVLAPAARAAQVGESLGEVARTVETGDPAADLLVRALGVAEQAGTGAGLAVEQALAAIREEAAVARLLRVKTTQARGSAWVLSGLPVVMWLALVALDVAALSFYATPLGALTGGVAVVLVACARWWSQRLVAGAAAAAAAADPLAAPRPRPDPRAICALALPTLLIGGVFAGPALAVPVAAIAGAIGWRRSTRPAGGPAPAERGGGTGDAVELLAIALEAGLSTVVATELVGRLAPRAARAPLAAAARRLHAGTPVDSAFADGGLAQVGAVLAATQRWGAPAGPALRNLATELRRERRAAAEQAAERVELALIFPTTLLTLPAFVLAVVPPLLWTTFANPGG